MRYNSGSKDDVIRYMASCAIRDRRTFIEAISCPFASDKMDAETARLVAETENEILDFRRFLK
jgi:hypothetical protein